MPALTFSNFQTGIDLRKSDQAVDNPGLRDCKNAYITGGYGVQKRPGLHKLSLSGLGSDTSGLFYYDGNLYVVSATPGAVPSLSGYGSPPAGSVIRLVLPDPDDPTATVSKVWQFFPFDSNLYVVVEFSNTNIRHFYNGLAITDSGCPQGKSACAHDSKIYATADNSDFIAYSATGDATDWSKIRDASAGLGIPVKQETPDEDIIAVTSYRDKLAVFMENSIQLWNTDPDPALIELETKVQNANLNYIKTIGNAGSDVIYLNDTTFESMSQKLYTDTLESTDIGSAIKSLVSPQLDLHAATHEPVGTYYAGLNQYVCILEKQIYVYSFSQTAQLSAWSRYEVPDNLQDITSYRQFLYVRASDEIFCFDPSALVDTPAVGIPVNIEVVVESSFQTLKKSGIWKQVFGSDVLMEGSGNVQYKYDSRSPTDFTTAQAISGDSRPGALLPVELMTTEIGYKITQSAEDQFLFSGITFYFNELGIF